ncbi:DUF6927 domain-containing protein [Bradyrhizobium sp. SZCCHNR3118]|uniref:DUF6927 domain-containing protein n=1 Tax=Bradyrhizobium sp. SZCCHNR3118 TaxID=3057468 RepID=UPI002916DD11|nr:hypothetical protein [Bradyrhizobium sp. SZCCHNR3118]
MGWLFYRKPERQTPIEAIKERCGAEWIAKHFVKAGSANSAVHIVAQFHEPDSKVYVPDDDGMVRAILVFAIRQSRGEFGYKDMSESMGPGGWECSPSIIKAASKLRPKTDEDGPLTWAHNYRERSLAKAAAKSKKQKLQEGSRVKLASPLSFGGVMLDEFTVVRCPVGRKRRIRTVFRAVETGSLCAIQARHLADATIS